MGDYCVQMPLLYSLKQNIRSGNIQFVMVFNIRNVCRKLWIFPSTNGSRTEKHNICYRLLLTSSHVPVFALFIAISFSPPAIIRFLSLHSYGPMIFFCYCREISYCFRCLVTSKLVYLSIPVEATAD